MAFLEPQGTSFSFGKIRSDTFERLGVSESFLLHEVAAAS